MLGSHKKNQSMDIARTVKEPSFIIGGIGRDNSLPKLDIQRIYLDKSIKEKKKKKENKIIGDSKSAIFKINSSISRIGQENSLVSRNQENSIFPSLRITGRSVPMVSSFLAKLKSTEKKDKSSKRRKLDRSKLSVVKKKKVDKKTLKELEMKGIKRSLKNLKRKLPIHTHKSKGSSKFLKFLFDKSNLRQLSNKPRMKADQRMVHYRKVVGKRNYFDLPSTKKRFYSKRFLSKDSQPLI